jgi:hypothetical protein
VVLSPRPSSLFTVLSYQNAAGMRYTPPRRALTPASLRETCRDAYYLGVLEEGDGHRADASSWYRVAVETEQVVPEFRWARAALIRWSERSGAPLPAGSAASDAARPLTSGNHVERDVRRRA